MERFSSLFKRFTLGFLLVFLLAFSHSSFADFIENINPEDRGELWLNAGMYSYHYDRRQHLNNNNIGFGAEYRFSSVASVTLGGYKNSDNTHTNYAGLYWQPIAVGSVSIGLVGGGFSGYLSTNNGGWFPAVFPVATIESGWIGANLFFIPTVQDKVHGVISLQIKIKVWDGNSLQR